MGLSDLSWQEAGETLARVAGARLTLPRAHYAQAIERGEIGDEDLLGALAEAEAEGDDLGLAGARSPARVKALLGAGFEWQPHAHKLKTVAEVADEVTGRHISRLITDSLSRWAACHFDQGQALWPSPWRELPPFAAWRQEALIDRSPELAGIPQVRSLVRALPETPTEAAHQALGRLGIPTAGRDLYLHRLAMSIGGWLAHARYRDWTGASRGQEAHDAVELLAIRLNWERIVFEALGTPALEAAWASARRSLVAGSNAELRSAVAFDLLLLRAQEHATQRRLFSYLPASVRERNERPSVQAAFCIDVRSEPIRRHLEAIDSGVQTIGFAGFFGIPMGFVSSEGGRVVPHCPAPVAYGLVASEGDVKPEADGWTGDAGTRRRQGLAAAWRSFKLAAVSCFGFVETAGLTYGVKLLADGLGSSWARRPSRSEPRQSDARAASQRELRLDLVDEAGIFPEGSLSLTERVALASSVLRGMSLTRNFARIVALVGHGASTANNPYAASFNCGACGGHPGGANARVAKALLNDPEVRAGLADAGIAIPDDTHFIAAQHDTTTDEIQILEADSVPEGHHDDLIALRALFEAAGSRNRAARAPLLGLEETDEPKLHAKMRERAQDWAQIRPEWGLAGCAAFIAAPRSRTAGVDLSGKAFLNDYAWREDEGFTTLETIMTAPVVVASWISLQYHASAADNAAFGSGSKPLHNVVGRLGVLEGNGGDLRVGLPLQSVHDGKRFVHRPGRLAVIIEAPTEAMNGVIARNAELGRLVNNGWIQLFAMNESGEVAMAYAGDLKWRELRPPSQTLAA
jgi:uncharacterized protein YbcC (UPF0753/DUF2309 family)